ncbi:MAG: hypothetical protein KGO49_05550 [Gammaproteobacteria bacterium]|nr:hypothetical protein [Gammaproteobacteria bacterium]
MKIKHQKSLGLAGAIATTALLTACGGGSSNSQPQSTVTGTGTAVDFYISGGTVTFTDCGNATTKTDANGNFTFPTGCSSSAVTVTGGTDIGTGLPFAGTIQAPKETLSATTPIIVSPLTTLIAQLDLISPGGANGSNASLIIGQLGLPYNPLTQDPMSNARSLQQNVVLQQLINQVTALMESFSTSVGGTLTPAQATQAAQAGIINAMLNAQNINGSFSLTNSTNISAIISASVTSAVTTNKTSFPSNVQTNTNTYASNVALVGTATISNLVNNVSNALSNVTIGSSPQATLSNIGANNIAQIVTTAQSTATQKIITPSIVAQLGSSDPTTQLTLSALGSSLASTNTTAPTLSNFLQITGVILNNGSEQTVSTASNQPLTATGALSNIQFPLNEVGSLVGTTTLPVQAALSYTINGNTVNLIINNVTLTFDSTGTLTGASVPATTTYSFSLSGVSNATATLTNQSADNLYANGKVNLSINSFLTKLKNSGTATGLTAAQIQSYTPTTSAPINVTFVMSTPNAVIGIGQSSNGNGVISAPSLSVGSGSMTTTGQGISAIVTSH